MVRVSGGDGSCLEKAIIIEDCDNSVGVHEEYNVIKKRFGEYKLLKQMLIKECDKIYDFLTLKVDNEEKKLYFEITNFFGKF
ncbi:MAG: hypothetical protein GF317_24250 [Candidatus Lokiarchaeota archaeon]|nr:hypothetical protein [Candidatus Lokiarchaeota archaeon]MBD3202486.1 hypothetical protein [Candidatus Lokiarchaeota archaeon]